MQLIIKKQKVNMVLVRSTVCVTIGSYRLRKDVISSKTKHEQNIFILLCGDDHHVRVVGVQEELLVFCTFYVVTNCGVADPFHNNTTHF